MRGFAWENYIFLCETTRVAMVRPVSASKTRVLARHMRRTYYKNTILLRPLYIMDTDSGEKSVENGIFLRETTRFAMVRPVSASETRVLARHMCRTYCKNTILLRPLYIMHTDSAKKSVKNIFSYAKPRLSRRFPGFPGCPGFPDI